MSRVQKGTDRYMYPFVPKPEKVQIGTTPFRGVPFVPGRTQYRGEVATTDLFGLEQQTPRTNDRPEAAALVEVFLASPLMLVQPIAPSLKLISPCSVFELAQWPIWLRQTFAPSTGRQPHRIERMGDVTRFIVVPVQDTAEWKAHEEARRARQKPPRPGKAYLTASNALRTAKQESMFHAVNVHA